MDIHISKLSQEGTIYWVLFEHGKFATPILILTDYEFEKLIKSYERQKEEKK